MSKKLKKDAVVLWKDLPVSTRQRAKRVVAVCEAFFAHTKHLHGLTKTAVKLLRWVAVIRQEAAIQQEAKKSLTATQWRIVQQALDLLAPLSQKNDKEKENDQEEVLSAVARRIAAIVRAAEGLSGAGRYSVRIVGIRDLGKNIELCVAASPRAGKQATTAMPSMDGWNRVALRPIVAVVVVRNRCVGDVAIKPQEDMADTARRILQRQTEQLISRQYGLAYPEDVEYVHEMRVALRRLRAAIRIFRKEFVGELKAESSQLRTFSDVLGVARDADVFIDFLCQYLKTCPRKAQPLLTALLSSQQRERGDHYRQLQATFRARKHRLFLQRLYERFQPGCKQVNQTAGKHIHAAGRASKILRRRLSKVTDFGHRLDLLSSDKQHQLRIACKKLRYTAEFFVHFYPPRLQRLVAVMTQMQDRLGTSHDADVYFARLEKYARKQYGKELDAQVTAALHTIRTHLRRMRRRALREAAATWKSFLASSTQDRWKKLIDGPSAK